jgi:hypothetical protein
LIGTTPPGPNVKPAEQLFFRDAAARSGRAFPSTPAEPQGTTPARMLRELAVALEALTTTAPLVLVLKDLHWSDVPTVNLLTYLAQRREA